MRKIVVIITLGVMGCLAASAQQYTGTSGLIHTPSAEMNPGGTAKIGAHFINQGNLPGNWTPYLYKGDTYNTFDYYLGIALFNWMELAYTCTAIMRDGGYKSKDRYFSAKFRPLKEGKYWPAIAIGANDIITKSLSSYKDSGSQLFFGNAYVAVTKNFLLNGHTLGVTASYRHFFKVENSKWNGVVGGVFWRPAFFPQMRVIAEWSGCSANFAVDALLWKFLLLQVSLYDFRYVNGGICFQLDLHPKKHPKDKNTKKDNQ